MKVKISLILVSLFMSITPIIGQHNSNKTDYSERDNWSILCDSIVHEIDVFFVHPTTYGPPANGEYLADLNNHHLNMITDLYSINRMTSAFTSNCNIFAPRYRQVNIEVLSMSEQKRIEYIRTPVADIVDAFYYYMANLNNGRPFILASHSQGSYVLQLILLKNPDIINKDKLIAAYMPGWTFTMDDIRDIGIPFSTSPNQLGGIISWNTIGVGGSSPVLYKGALCTNPLSWTSDTVAIPAIENHGAWILYNDNTDVDIDHFTSARINNLGGLEIPEPISEIMKNIDMTMGSKCFHKYDYDFFFQNIKENVDMRCNTYLKKVNKTE